MRILLLFYVKRAFFPWRRRSLHSRVDSTMATILFVTVFVRGEKDKRREKNTTGT